MHADRFRHLLDTDGPFASVYFDDSHDTEDAAAQRELKWRGLREQLEEQGASAEIISDIERTILDGRPPVGRSGRGIVAGPRGVLLNEHLIRPAPSTVVRVSEVPYLVPIVEHGVQHIDYVTVAVDHAGADLTIHRGGRSEKETVDGGGYPVHHAKGAENPGYGDPQLRSDEASRKNIRVVVDRIAALVDSSNIEVVFVIGEVSSRSDLLAELPERVSKLAVQLQAGARNSGNHDEEAAAAIHEEFLKRRLAVMDDAAQRFEAELGRESGMAVEGLHGVCAALRQGAVETLIIGEIGDATVVAGDELLTIAPNENVLSEQGAAATRTLRADEALPMAAIATDASLVRTDERISPRDGVAAVLRYAPAAL
jgi:peptide chain release factor subunit 1